MSLWLFGQVHLLIVQVFTLRDRPLVQYLPHSNPCPQGLSIFFFDLGSGVIFSASRQLPGV